MRRATHRRVRDENEIETRLRIQKSRDHVNDIMSLEEETEWTWFIFEVEVGTSLVAQTCTGVKKGTTDVEIEGNVFLASVIRVCILSTPSLASISSLKLPSVKIGSTIFGVVPHRDTYLQSR